MASSLRIWVVGGAAIAAFAVAEAPGFAMTFRAPVPQLVGPITFPQLRVEFDFGQEFSHIESVALELVASATATEYEYCGTVSTPQPCERRSVQGGILA